LGGPLSYFLGAVRAMARHQAIGARLTADGAAVDPGPYRLISVTNGPTFGAGMRITPAARVDDGHLDLVCLSRVSRLGMLGVFPKIYWGGHLTHPAVTNRPVERLEIQTDGPEHFEIDGELGFGLPPFRIEVAPHGLRVARFGAP
jgi:diacylglycerol kinase (ATP)